MTEQPNTFNSIQKVSAILKVLAHRSPLRLTEIAEAAMLNKATTLRILGTLMNEGFVNRVSGGKSYEFGEEARAISISARSSINIAELAQPSLLRVAAQSADTALLSVRSGIEALYIARAVGSHPLQPNYLQIGSRRPLGVGAGSLALLAWLPADERNAIVEVVTSGLANMPRITPKLLKERMAAAHKYGHTLLIDAAYLGMGGIGVPVRDESGQVIAALSIGAASDRIRRREPELAKLLKREAATLSRAMAKPHRRARPKWREAG
jgi:DNA-binding IclR family transcriptional regulator